MRGNTAVGGLGHHRHRLRADLSTRKVGGQELEQWQVEVTAGGRIWYCLDQENRKVWIVRAGTGHPRLTD
jgi:hypothetical protein